MSGVTQVKGRVTAAVAVDRVIDFPLDNLSGAVPTTAGAASAASFDVLTSATAAATVVKSQAIPGSATASVSFVHVELVAAAAAARYLQLFVGAAPAAGDRPLARSDSLVPIGGQWEIEFPQRLAIPNGLTIIESTTQDTWTDPGAVTELRAFSNGTL